MGKENQESTAVAEAPQAFEMTLEEFCSQASVTDKRVELLGGFYAQERAAGRVKGMQSDYASRYSVFQNQPA